LPSSHEAELLPCSQVPALQVSSVQPLPSSQSPLSSHCGVAASTAASLAASTAASAAASAALASVPASTGQEPLSSCSQPLTVSHESSVQALLSSQLSGAPAVQAPSTQLSGVQTLSSVSQEATLFV
jgi:hypothetical protein